jgi:hypothetical protein
MAKRATPLAKAKLEAATAPQNGHTEHQSVSARPPGEPVLALPEAPASANCHILMEGRQVHVTLRDTDETRLLTRLATLLRQYPLAQLPTHDTRPPTPTPVCQWHGAMKESTTATGT